MMISSGWSSRGYPGVLVRGQTNYGDGKRLTNEHSTVASAFTRLEVAALGSSNSMDEVPTFRQVSVSADVAKSS
jgi:hypothetical protein